MRVARGEVENSFPTGLVLDDQLFGLSIVASSRLEVRRGVQLEADSQVLFHLLNRGIWDQDFTDAPRDGASRAIRYAAVMGERLWRIADGNTLLVRAFPFFLVDKWILMTSFQDNG